MKRVCILHLIKWFIQTPESGTWISLFLSFFKHTEAVKKKKKKVKCNVICFIFSAFMWTCAFVDNIAGWLMLSVCFESNQTMGYSFPLLWLNKKRKIDAGQKVSPPPSFSIAVFAIDCQHFCRERHSLSEGLLKWRRLTINAASSPQHFSFMFDVAYVRRVTKQNIHRKTIQPWNVFSTFGFKKEKTQKIHTVV